MIQNPAVKTLKSIFVLSLLFALPLVSFSISAPVPAWDKTYGGLKTETLAAMQQTSDGGFILGGTSDSDTSKYKASASFGNADFWIVKTDATGNKIWDKTFGGTGAETFQVLQQTSDGGYILGGSSQSGAGGNKSEPNLGSYDFWIVKTDAFGNKLWDKTFGGQGFDFLHSLEQTPDGGYVIGGVSFNPVVNAQTAAEATFMVIKLDGLGNQVWRQAVNNLDAAAQEPIVLRVTSDNGFILAGSLNTTDFTNSKMKTKGASDFHLIKLNAGGNREWEQVYGGKDDEFLSSLQVTTDGGYVLGGISHSGKNGDKTDGAKGKGDFWVIKVNSRGEKLWDRSFGGSDYDYLSALQHTQDEGFLLGGISRSGKSGDKSQTTYGKADFWVIKLDANGNKVYEQAFGGAKDDELYALTETTEGGVLLGGNSESGIDNNKTEANAGGKDIWLVKLKVPAISWYSF